MENYEIHFNESERDAVLKIISSSNDVLVNNIKLTSVGITIQQDDAEPIYQALLERIDRELPHARTQNLTPDLP
jgi:hypothetical protein